MYAFRVVAIFCLLTTIPRTYVAYSAAGILDYNSSDLWRSWLLTEEDAQPSHQQYNSGGLVSRRITPKSVFIAPTFEKCSDGYRPDGMGGCVKIVRVNEAAQWDFLLQMLNSMYATSFTVGEPAIREEHLTPPTPAQYDSMTVDRFQEDPSGPFRLSMSTNQGSDGGAYRLPIAAAADAAAKPVPEEMLPEHYQTPMSSSNNHREYGESSGPFRLSVPSNRGQEEDSSGPYQISMSSHQNQEESGPFHLSMSVNQYQEEDSSSPSSDPVHVSVSASQSSEHTPSTSFQFPTSTNHNNNYEEDTSEPLQLAMTTIQYQEDTSMPFQLLSMSTTNHEQEDTSAAFQLPITTTTTTSLNYEDTSEPFQLSVAEGQEQEDDSGPFHLSIPLISANKTEARNSTSVTKN